MKDVLAMYTKITGKVSCSCQKIAASLLFYGFNEVLGCSADLVTDDFCFLMVQALDLSVDLSAASAATEQ